MYMLRMVVTVRYTCLYFLEQRVFLLSLDSDRLKDSASVAEISILFFIGVLAQWGPQLSCAQPGPAHPKSIPHKGLTIDKVQAQHKRSTKLTFVSRRGAAQQSSAAPAEHKYVA
jgi:hypothetical protein